MLITGNFEKMHKVFSSSEHPKFYQAGACLTQ